jgi:hypothetical protein
MPAAVFHISACLVISGRTFLRPPMQQVALHSSLTTTLTAFLEVDCLAATQLASDGGCCASHPIYNVCNICGDAAFYPENIVFRTGTCDYVQSVANTEICATYSSLIAPFCCGKAAVSAETTETPTPDSDESSGEPVPNPAPSSSPAMWSAGPVSVSMMCLTTSTFLGGWVRGGCWSRTSILLMIRSIDRSIDGSLGDVHDFSCSGYRPLRTLPAGSH